MRSRRLRAEPGFTLVELLVVIAIVGVLVALLLPAIQAARESARRNECVNNLKQVGLAVQSCHDTQRTFPAGRDGGDDFSTSWAFRLLPFMEELSIFKSRAPKSPSRAPENATAMRTPVPGYYCPTRREPAADRDFAPKPGFEQVSAAAAGGDYAANAGAASASYGLADGPMPSVDPEVAGPIFTRSRIAARHVTDGLSKTIAVGERHLPPPRGDVAPEMVSTFQGDTAFFCGDMPQTVMRTAKDGLAAGEDDTSSDKFGSLHPSVCNFVFLDGHVQSIATEFDVVMLQHLSAIGDGNVVSAEL
jgi:prepilin-type N-terminal cleavage/methylation domain-containing protein/prepilin-type processing-associated H-X9-DG protein